MISGREEIINKEEKTIERIVADAPDIIKRYTYNFTEKTTTTKKKYISIVIEFLKYVDAHYIADINNPETLGNLKPSDISRFLDAIKYKFVNGEKIKKSDSFIGLNLYAISNFYEFLISEEIVGKNPCDRVKAPKIKGDKEIVAMTMDEINDVKQTICNGVGSHKSKAFQKDWVNRDLAIFTLGCTTGLRVTALIEINISDIDFENMYIKVIEKGNKKRIIYIGENTASILRIWIEDRKVLMDGYSNNDALFISNRRTRINQESVRGIIKKYTKNINGKHITPHKMRSSCATNLYEQTGDLFLAKEVLGHSSIETIKRYAKMSEERLRKASTILD